jgi:hypothetical protein
MQKGRKPIEGTGETTNSKEMVLYWGQGKHRLTIPLTKTTNVAAFYLAPGYSKFQTFLLKIMQLVTRTKQD